MKTKGGTRAKKHPAIEAIGWVGAAAVLLAYGLVSFGVITANGFWYPVLNLVGAVGIATIAEAKHLVQSVVLNIIWGLIALAALIKFIF